MLDEAMRRIQEAKRTRQTVLDLSDLDLTELPEEACELTGIIKLDLGGNRLATLPESIGELTNLTELILTENRLTALPESIRRLGTLTHLDLGSNRLTSLVAGIGDLTSLVKLNLSHNDLREVPASLCNLAALVELNLRGNELEALPDGIGTLANLVALNAAGNDLETVPDSIGSLKRLRVLNLRDNRLAALPEPIGTLPELTDLDLGDNRITELPDSIGDLRTLTSLDCSANNLKHLPDAIGDLTNLTDLSLDNNRLDSLPEAIGNLTGLTDLALYKNRLRALPASIGSLTGLTELVLFSNRLTALPDSIARLTALELLDVSYNRLELLPEIIGELVNLRKLDARDNNLLSLPDSIGNLVALTELDLWDSDIEELPDSIGNLTALTEIDLAFNRLRSLPDSIGRLTALARIDLGFNQLAYLPDSLGNLTSLAALDVGANQLTSIPHSIGRLSALETLEIEENRLVALPDSLGDLAALTEISLQSNRLSTLPASLSAIKGLKEIQVAGNPLAPEVAAASASGHDGLMAFLKAIATDGVDVREAKLVVVGEGAVGKSTLLAAMMGEPFEEDRSSTHGIEVKPLTLGNAPDDCVLNAWDFGGQPTYRPTHQLFFTAPAVYLVVWKPRHGSRQDNVEEWIELIRRRAGDDVRVHVVATHGGPKDRFAHIDEAALRRIHGQVIAGFHHIDSRTGDGIDALKAALRETAAGLPHFARRLPGGWRRFQDSQRRTPEPYLEYPEYLARAAEHGLTETSARTLATVATDLGHWCHYPNIPGLDQLVVLKGDWLSAAVSLVIDDPQTVRDHGLIEHSSLKEIWDDPRNPPHLRYPEKVHRILLRLMEEYEISYRVNGGHGSRPPTSLIAQLVDPSTPPLDAWEDYGRGLPVQSRICRFSDASENFHLPEGLIYRLIVRLHQFSLGRERYEQSLHWTGGLVIDHGLHGRALIRLERNQLTVAVKAVAPEYLLTMVVEEIKAHVSEFWHGVKVHTLVSCGGQCNDPDDSRLGQWDLERLFNRRMKGKSEISCNSCDEDVSIQHLLSGVSTATTREERFTRAVERALDPKFTREVNGLSRVEDRDWSDVRVEATGVISQAESFLQDMLKALEDEAAFGPRLFTLNLSEASPRSPGHSAVTCQVTLWCEYSRKPCWALGDDADAGVFFIDLPRAWLAQAEPWINAMATILKAAMPIDVDDTALEQTDQVWGRFGERAFFTRDSSIDVSRSDRNPGSGEPVGALLRELHSMILERSPYPQFGGLVRVRNRGRYLWVHPRFEAELNPGLPEMDGAG